MEKKHFVFEGIADVRVFDEIRKFIMKNNFQVGFKMHDDFSTWWKYLPDTEMEGFVETIGELIESHETLDSTKARILLQSVNATTPKSWASEALTELGGHDGNYELEDVVMTFVNQAIRNVTAGHATKYAVGDRVWHVQYGIGTVDSYVEYDNSALTVVFDDVITGVKETRTVFVAYIRPSSGREYLHRTSVYNPRFATFRLGENFYNYVGDHLEMYSPVEGEDGTEYDVHHIDLDMMTIEERAALHQTLRI